MAVTVTIDNSNYLDQVTVDPETADAVYGPLGEQLLTDYSDSTSAGADPYNRLLDPPNTTDGFNVLMEYTALRAGPAIFYLSWPTDPTKDRDVYVSLHNTVTGAFVSGFQTTAAGGVYFSLGNLAEGDVKVIRVRFAAGAAANTADSVVFVCADDGARYGASYAIADAPLLDAPYGLPMVFDIAGKDYVFKILKDKVHEWPKFYSYYALNMEIYDAAGALIRSLPANKTLDMEETDFDADGRYAILKIACATTQYGKTFYLHDNTRRGFNSASDFYATPWKSISFDSVAPRTRSPFSTTGLISVLGGGSQLAEAKQQAAYVLQTANLGTVVEFDWDGGVDAESPLIFFENHTTTYITLRFMRAACSEAKLRLRADNQTALSLDATYEWADIHLPPGITAIAVGAGDVVEGTMVFSNTFTAVMEVDTAYHASTFLLGYNDQFTPTKNAYYRTLPAAQVVAAAAQFSGTHKVLAPPAVIPAGTAEVVLRAPTALEDVLQALPGLTFLSRGTHSDEAGTINPTAGPAESHIEIVCNNTGTVLPISANETSGDFPKNEHAGAGSEYLPVVQYVAPLGSRTGGYRLVDAPYVGADDWLIMSLDQLRPFSWQVSKSRNRGVFMPVFRYAMPEISAYLTVGLVESPNNQGGGLNRSGYWAACITTEDGFVRATLYGVSGTATTPGHTTFLCPNTPIDIGRFMDGGMLGAACKIYAVWDNANDRLSVYATVEAYQHGSTGIVASSTEFAGTTFQMPADAYTVAGANLLLQPERLCNAPLQDGHVFFYRAAGSARIRHMPLPGAPRTVMIAQPTEGADPQRVIIQKISDFMATGTIDPYPGVVLAGLAQAVTTIQVDGSASPTTGAVVVGTAAMSGFPAPTQFYGTTAPYAITVVAGADMEIMTVTGAHRNASNEVDGFTVDRPTPILAAFPVGSYVSLSSAPYNLNSGAKFGAPPDGFSYGMSIGPLGSTNVVLGHSIETARGKTPPYGLLAIGAAMNLFNYGPRFLTLGSGVWSSLDADYTSDRVLVIGHDSGVEGRVKETVLVGSASMVQSPAADEYAATELVVLGNYTAVASVSESVVIGHGNDMGQGTGTILLGIYSYVYRAYGSVLVGHEVAADGIHQSVVVGEATNVENVTECHIVGHSLDLVRADTEFYRVAVFGAVGLTNADYPAGDVRYASAFGSAKKLRPHATSITGPIAIASDTGSSATAEELLVHNCGSGTVLTFPFVPAAQTIDLSMLLPASATFFADEVGVFVRSAAGSPAGTVTVKISNPASGTVLFNGTVSVVDVPGADTSSGARIKLVLAADDAIGYSGTLRFEILSALPAGSFDVRPYVAGMLLATPM